MRIGIVTSVCVHHDAISSAAVGQAARLRALAHHVHLFTTHLDRPLDVPATVLRDAWALHLDPDFRACDVVIFHWGILNPLLDALWLLDARQRAAVHFHNVTSPHLVRAEQRSVIEASIHQIGMIHDRAVKLWTFSEFNRRTLLDWGVPPDDIWFVPFAVTAPRPLKQCVPDGLHVLNVGRLVPAKGVHTLVEAASLVRRSLEGPFTVTICGNEDFSDQTYAQQLREKVHDLGLESTVTFMPNLSDDELWAQFERHNVLVAPSLHEGFCVPVLEAYLAGAHVIGTTATNLPFVVQPPDPVVPPESPDAMAAAMVAMSVTVRRSDDTWRANVRALLETYSERNELRSLACALEGLRSDSVADAWPSPTR